MTPELVTPKNSDYDIPPVTLLFGYFHGITQSQLAANRAKLRSIVQGYSPGLTNLEAGHLTGTIMGGVTAPYDRGTTRLEPDFEYHRNKGLTYYGGTGGDFLNTLDGIVSEGTALCLLDVYGNMTAESTE